MLTQRIELTKVKEGVQNDYYHLEDNGQKEVRISFLAHRENGYPIEDIPIEYRTEAIRVGYNNLLFALKNFYLATVLSEKTNTDNQRIPKE